MTGAELITKERHRQITTEGFDAKRDSQYIRGQLADAAFCYIKFGMSKLIEGTVPYAWPFPAKWWKPKDQITNLVKAGALIAAEIDRLQNEKDSKSVQT